MNGIKLDYKNTSKFYILSGGGTILQIGYYSNSSVWSSKNVETVPSDSLQKFRGFELGNGSSSTTSTGNNEKTH